MAGTLQALPSFHLSDPSGYGAFFWLILSGSFGAVASASMGMILQLIVVTVTTRIGIMAVFNLLLFLISAGYHPLKLRSSLRP